MHGPNGYHNWAGTAPTHDLVMAFETEEGKILNTLLKPGESTTENPYMNREPRFYATIGYDGAEWGRPRAPMEPCSMRLHWVTCNSVIMN